MLLSLRLYASLVNQSTIMFTEGCKFAAASVHSGEIHMFFIQRNDQTHALQFLQYFEFGDVPRIGIRLYQFILISWVVGESEGRVERQDKVACSEKLCDFNKKFSCNRGVGPS
mgnify:CR=1 FL=1